MTIRPKTPKELDAMREGGKILDNVLQSVNDFVAPGKTLKEIDAFIHKLIIEAGGNPSFLGFNGYPAASCLSPNDVVVHGIPNAYIVKEGDIIGIDVGVEWEGYHTDAAFAKPIGSISNEAQKLLRTTQEALKHAVEVAIAGNQVQDIGAAVEDFVRSQGDFGIIRDLTGHGIGRNLQESPNVPNYRTKDTTALVDNMTLALEPMLTLGDWRVTLDDDGWTIRTKDGSLSAQFETTVIIRENDPEILVPFPLGFSVDQQK
jgi:methionyl aminopeptidase